jgi:hypothetical protein
MGMNYEYKDWNNNSLGVAFGSTTNRFTVTKKNLESDSKGPLPRRVTWKENPYADPAWRSVMSDAMDRYCAGLPPGDIASAVKRDIDACLADFERQMREGR